MSRGAPLVASADSGPPIRPPPAGQRRQQFKAGSRSHQGARAWLRRSPFRGPCAGRLATAVHSPDHFLTRWLRRASPAAFAAYCIAAAFGAYFCMYAFRKPWSAATFEGQQLLGLGLKEVLVASQLVGYTASKFIGLRFVSALDPARRARVLLALIAAAELALLGFALAPAPAAALSHSSLERRAVSRPSPEGCPMGQTIPKFRTVAPLARALRSTTSTERLRRAPAHAAASPTMPPPTMTRS